MQIIYLVNMALVSLDWYRNIEQDMDHIQQTENGSCNILVYKALEDCYLMGSNGQVYTHHLSQRIHYIVVIQAGSKTILIC